MLRHAVRLNSLTDIFLTKLDILSPLPTLKVCVAYEIDGRRVERMPYHQSDLHKAAPVYEELPGWDADLSGARVMADLPAEARTYLDLIEDLAGVPITLVSVGAERSQTIVRDGRVSDRRRPASSVPVGPAA